MTAAAPRVPAEIDHQAVRGAGSCQSISAARARAQQQTSGTSLLL